MFRQFRRTACWLVGSVVVGVFAAVSAADGRLFRRGAEASQPAEQDQGKMAAIAPESPGAGVVGLQRNPVRTLSSQQQIDAFLRLAELKTGRNEEVRVFAELLADAVRRMQAAIVELKEIYDVQPDANYSYERETSTLYRLAAGSGSELQRTEHRVFNHPEEAERLLMILQAREASHAQSRVLSKVLAERRDSLDQINQRLEQHFSLTAAGNYIFDKGSGVVYELVSSAGDEGSAGP